MREGDETATVVTDSGPSVVSAVVGPDDRYGPSKAERTVGVAVGLVMSRPYERALPGSSGLTLITRGQRWPMRSSRFAFSRRPAHHGAARRTSDVLQQSRTGGIHAALDGVATGVACKAAHRCPTSCGGSPTPAVATSSVPSASTPRSSTKATSSPAPRSEARSRCGRGSATRGPRRSATDHRRRSAVGAVATPVRAQGAKIASCRSS